MPVVPDLPLFTETADNEFFGLPMEMARTIRLTGEAIAGHHCRVRLPYNKAFTNSRGDMHGGMIATLFDAGLSAACRAHDPRKYGVVTIDLTIHFMAPAPGDMICHAVCERRGKSISFARGEIRNDAGELLGMATGTFKLLERGVAQP
ncbi:hypothetical protein CCO03_13625 [Comamonas serinivorans]|uniref:Thioesterase domain-containing protein n=1 Tax=Comamonas serinivorans TaxID=1082851 RepID=A0A1Y0EPT3_9BURK|nr:PaaI family thioesterase [Comamonas serinivorans]ARU05586.1 hypothetical protein CCO03_13625 [Comamonas serinivorans]